MAPEHTESDLAHWQRYCDEAGLSGAASSHELSFSDLAAYADGRLNDVERDRIEAALAEAPDARALLEAALDRDAVAGAMVPRRIRSRARSLVAPTRRHPVSIDMLWRIGAVAAALAVAFVGWRLGTGAVGPESDTNAMTPERLAQEMSFGLFAADDELVVESVLLASLEVES